MKSKMRRMLEIQRGWPWVSWVAHNQKSQGSPTSSRELVRLRLGRKERSMHRILRRAHGAETTSLRPRVAKLAVAKTAGLWSRSWTLDWGVEMDKERDTSLVWKWHRQALPSAQFTVICLSNPHHPPQIFYKSKKPSSSETLPKIGPRQR